MDWLAYVSRLDPKEKTTLCRSAAIIAALQGPQRSFSEWFDGQQLQTDRHLFIAQDISSFEKTAISLNSLSLNSRKNIEELLKSSSHIVDLFSLLRSSEDTDASRKGKGAIYTPMWLADHITKTAFGHWRRLHRSGIKPRSICDPSCGIGPFLYAAGTDFEGAPTILGYDIDSVAIDYARLLGKATGMNWDITVRDALVNGVLKESPSFFDVPQDMSDGIDVFLGNPPYVRHQNLDKEYVAELRERYPALAKGSFDLSVLFLDHALRCLAPGGIFSYIVSSKFTSAGYGKVISESLANTARVLSIDDLGDEQIFPGFTTYTCIVTAAKLPPAKRFTVTRYPGGILATESLSAPKSFTLPQSRLQTHPWDFTEGIEQDVLRKLKAADHPLLDSLFRIVQGVRTGANNVFVVPRSKRESLDVDLLVPFVGGEHIRRFRIDDESQCLIFPYRFTELDEPALLRESQLKQYVLTWDYLAEHRSVLEDRARDNGAPWYAFSRGQNLGLCRMPKILVREMMPRSEFAVDYSGSIAFSSGYALIPLYMPSTEMKLWTAILNTNVMEFALRQHSTQLHSGWFRLLKHYLGRVRLPYLQQPIKATALKLAERLEKDPGQTDLWYELNLLVGDAFGLNRPELEAIDRYLDDCHERSLSERQKQALNVAVPSPQESAQNKYQPVTLHKYDHLHRDRFDLRRQVTFVPNKKLPIHRWYSFTQGYSASLVTQLLQELNVTPSHTVLDPFVGSGTTSVVCKQTGVASVGYEISPLMAWIAQAKTRNWDISSLQSALVSIGEQQLVAKQAESLPFERFLAKAFSSEILGQLVSISTLARSSIFNTDQRLFIQLGLVSIMEEVSQIRKHGSHYRYMNSSENIGLQKLNIQLVEADAEIRPILLSRLTQILEDIIDGQNRQYGGRCEIIREDFLAAPSTRTDKPEFDFVITSPPYLNRNNYLSQQKAEMALLGLVSDERAYKNLVLQTLRSHVESRLGASPETQFQEVAAILNNIELTPGNNVKIPHMIAGYFEDMDKVMRRLLAVLKPGARCAFVVGNSRWGGVVVPVDHLLLHIAERHGFIPEKVLVTRLKGNSPQQMRKYGLIPVRESIVIFRKP